MLKIEYKNKGVQEYCTLLKKAKRKFNNIIGTEILSTINFLENAESFLDVISYTPFHLHPLKGTGKNTFAIDIHGRRSGYRMVIKLFDEQRNLCNSELVFDKIKVKLVCIVLVEEVTNHYE